ncbi:MAG: DUF6411 family protein [Candidatus Dormibacter sp.]|uniref:DUF6411 family protein n=1 Tax=Candidatus Dormibacter sp. TaxID=2973982 RepID=UPI0026972C2C
MTLIAVLIVVCLVLLAVGFLAPRRSRRLQRDIDSGSDKAQRKADEKTPDALTKFVQKPIENARKAADKSTEVGREGREKASGEDVD